MTGDDETTHAEVIDEFETIYTLSDCLLKDVDDAAHIPETKADYAAVQAIFQLAGHEADRPGPDATATEREIFQHEQVVTLISVARRLLEAASYSEVMGDREAGRLLGARRATDQLVDAHKRTIHWRRDQASDEAKTAGGADD